MYKIALNGPNRLDLELDGKLDSDAMKVALDELCSKAEGIEHGRMLYRITNFELPTFGAMAVEMSRLPKLFGLIGKFDRCAVLTEKRWIQKASEIEGSIVPGLKIKGFDLDQESDAEAWLAQDG